MRRKSGLTLLELTVVILVLLSLISILLIGARAWKKGSDRAACILNIRNVQQAARSHANMNELAIGATLLPTSLMGNAELCMTNPNEPVIGTNLPPPSPMVTSEFYMPNPPLCPGDKSGYSYLAVVPALGTLYASCNNALNKATHIPTAHDDW